MGFDARGSFHHPTPHRLQTKKHNFRQQLIQKHNIIVTRMPVFAYINVALNVKVSLVPIVWGKLMSVYICPICPFSHWNQYCNQSSIYTTLRVLPNEYS